MQIKCAQVRSFVSTRQTLATPGLGVESANLIPMLRLICFLLLIPAIAFAGSFEEEAGEGDIPRFGILADGLYRGGQPTAQGFQFLKQKGIKTIINFRAEDNSE